MQQKEITQAKKKLDMSLLSTEHRHRWSSPAMILEETPYE